MDERLDEISRAIVATSRPAPGAYAQADAFDRLEARIASLAASVESTGYDRTSDTILQRMGELAQRVDQLSEQGSRPAIDLQALTEQLSAIVRHLQNAPAAISISDFRDLEDRVLQIIDRLEIMPRQAEPDPAFATSIDQRFAHLARQLDEHQQMSEHSDIRLTDAIEARFDDMARYIEQKVPSADATHDAIRSLELQIAGLAEHLSRSNDQHAEIAAISPRLDTIEASIATNRDFIVETARNAAAEAIRNTANFGSDHDSSVAHALAGDLKTLETLARKSEDRNTKTFEAIHDTLLKIVDRLASLESGPVPVYRPDAYDAESVAKQGPSPDFSAVGYPSPEITPAGDAAMLDSAPRERTSLFAGLTSGFKGRGTERAAPLETMPDVSDERDPSAAEPEFDESMLNQPLEPGSGMPDLNSILKRVRDDRREMLAAGDPPSGKADFIAVARRAAQAAAADAEAQSELPGIAGDALDASARRGFLARRRRPILLAIGAIMIAIAGLQLKHAFFDHPAAPETTASIAKPSEPQRKEDAAPAAPIPDAPSRGLAAAQPAPESVESVIAAQQPTPSTIDPTPEKTPGVDAVAAIPTIPTEGMPEALREAAAAGDNKALFEIGDRYTDGRGVAQDYAKAAEWYGLAATRGFAPAQYRLGNFNEKGLGIARDLTEARTWYQRAAEQGNASAMHNLAVLFAAGMDGAPDNDSAAHWFIQAAELGVKDSQFNLGILSAKGMGVPQNLEESYKWFALAANAGDKEAARKRDDVARIMTPGQQDRARAATALWKPKQMNADANALDVPQEWREKPMTTGSVDMEKAVRNIQLILNRNGYDAGGSDGKIGTKTRDAIMAFQKDNGMKPTGSIDKDLVRNLLEKNG
ncbi:MAG: peptidoglycan-binding protein [Alphaproteobacteria bacterium]